MAALLQDLFDPLRPLLGQDHLPLLLVVVEVGGILDQLFHEDVDGPVEFAAVLGGPGDDERRARLVDQDRVHFVDDHEVMAALDHLVRVVDQVVAQIVEAELVVRAVGHVAAIGGLALALAQAVDDHAHRQAQEAVDLAHPVGVALGQVVVDRDQVHALAGERVQINRRGRHQGLALASAHLGDAALVQDHPAHQLHIVVPLAQGAPGRLAHHGEGFFQDVVQARALGQPLAELDGLVAQRVVRQSPDLRFQGVDLGHPCGHGLDLAVVGGAEKAFEDHEMAPDDAA
jgi:hypothetical protein